MESFKKPVMILIAEDDEDYQVLIRTASREADIDIPLVTVENGEDLLDFILHRKKYADQENFGLPNLILLDLNMPKVDGRKAIEEIKNDPHTRMIPVIVLTTSRVEEDINYAYAAGANSYIIKPTSYSALVNIMKAIKNFWFETAALP